MPSSEDPARRSRAFTVQAALAAALCWTIDAGVVRAQQPALPPPAAAAVEFARDVAPVLRASCARCHARGQKRGGFSIESRDALLAGGDGGPAVVPGRSAESLLIHLVAGLDPDNVMPRKGSRLSAEQIGVLRRWIDDGATWAAGVSFARTPPRNLDPPEGALPPGRAEAHPVDRLLAPYLASRQVRLGPAVDDRSFARRVYLDAIGLLPTPAQLEAFAADRRPDKRRRLVQAVLSDRQAYAEHWLSFWNDLLRNDYRGPGYIDGGRQQITGWLYRALVDNLRYDEFVRQLVNPAPGAEGFTKGIVWRGVVNASQSPPMQAAQNVSQVFMGVNLKCASCHDSFIDEWQLSDAYGLAGIYAEGPLEMVECDRPTGRTAPLQFIYPMLGHVDTSADRQRRLEQLAAIVTGPRNGRLPRTIVNRLWQRFMGRGLVEPLDDMEQPAWSPALLDWLAADLVAHDYDVTRTIAQILTSRAYQSAAVDRAEEGAATFVFRGPLVRRLSAEQFVDAVGRMTGVWPLESAASFGEARATAAGPVRASLAAADPLMTALGRPGREQVVTSRVTAATTLQALELQNGATLARWLRAGAERLQRERTWTPAALADHLFATGLGRRPTERELALVRNYLGPSPDADAVEDLLWTMVMLPEFQLWR